jgi:hypothetical protein
MRIGNRDRQQRRTTSIDAGKRKTLGNDRTGRRNNIQILGRTHTSHRTGGGGIRVGHTRGRSNGNNVVNLSLGLRNGTIKKQQKRQSDKPDQIPNLKQISQP